MNKPYQYKVNSYHQYYKQFPSINLLDRTWPNNTITKAPTWCSVDLRDGNQALVNPMDITKKKKMWDLLVESGFKEIEVGFPSASQTDYDFLRTLIEEDLIPDDVTIQVLTQAREDLIKRTCESLKGASNVIVHLYNSTSTLQRKVVFCKSEKEIIKLAVEGAKACLRFYDDLSNANVRFEYSPESFTGTELEFSVEICEAVMDVWNPSEKNPVVLNFPSTVEMSTPNVYADQIEWICRNLSRKSSRIISVHTHNDRGTGIAAAELAQMAGAQRVEGTLFGNGERTGNTDLVVLALNLMTQGIDPKLYFDDISKVRVTAEECTEIPVHQRHPYSGDLVFTAFSGSHQDAINKGISAIGEDYSFWEVPYLPINPKHVGRTLQDVVRVNSQSGKGGIAYVMRADHGFDLPRGLQVEFSKIVQKKTDEKSVEMQSEELLALFNETYLSSKSDDLLLWIGNTSLLSDVTQSNIARSRLELSVEICLSGETKRISGSGSGPVEAFVTALAKHNIYFDIHDYVEHSIGMSSGAKAVAYVAIKSQSNSIVWGVGIDENILTSSLKAVVSAVNRL